MSDPAEIVLQMRSQGLPDNIIEDQLKGEGLADEQIAAALAQQESPMPQYYAQPARSSESPDMQNIYERIEQIAEGLIDEKWEALAAEIRKVIDWKNKVEERLGKLSADVDKLKEDFNLLHQGVLGKIEDYDNRMGEVRTELKAVGRVFKDVIPEFVDNVKELRDITGKLKK